MKKNLPMIAKPMGIKTCKGKVYLRDGESVTFSTHRETDEGYSSTYQVIEREGNMLRSFYKSYSRDCDGPYEYYKESECHLNERFAGYKKRPKWKEVRSRQRDYFAEAMGY